MLQGDARRTHLVTAQVERSCTKCCWPIGAGTEHVKTRRGDGVERRYCLPCALELKVVWEAPGE